MTMSAEQFLNSIRHLDFEISALDHERVRLDSQRQDILEKAENITVSFSGVCVQTGVSSKTESLGLELAATPTPEQLVRKLNSYQHRINKKIDELIDRKQKAMDIIESIAEAKYRALLTHRYLSNFRWSTIADLMGYTDVYVRLALKEEAVKAFDKLFESSKKEGPHD